MTPTSDPKWPTLITRMLEVKSRLAEVDGGLWPYRLPELAAKPSAIAEAEFDLGVKLPASFREFLLHADGWSGTFQTIDILGCQELLTGPHQERATAILNGLEPEDWKNLDLVPEAILPIGVSLKDVDLFVIDLSVASQNEAPVVWVAGERIDEWPTFADCFASMIEYNRREITHFVRQ
jgi:hypothetical protein